MRMEPVLVLVSGEAGRSTGSLAFTTTAKGLQFTSCSGLLLAPGSIHGGVMLMPAAVLRPWIQPGASWLTSLGSIEPPPLTPDCSICAVGPAAALSGGAASCIPIATVRAPAVSRCASQLLQSLNRDSLSPIWAFEWHIGGPSCTAAEQGAFVLCWAQPFASGESAGIAPPAAAARPFGAAASWLSPLPPLGKAPGVDATQLPLADPRVITLLLSARAALQGSCPAAAEAACSVTPAATPAAAATVATASPMLGSCCGRGGAPASASAPGQPVAILGSPFGCLAPFHFANAHINGAVACLFPAPPDELTAAANAAAGGAPRLSSPSSASAAAGGGGCNCILGPAMLALDAHVFPGMEGGLVTPLQLQPLQLQPLPLQLQPQTPSEATVQLPSAKEPRSSHVGDACGLLPSVGGSDDSRKDGGKRAAGVGGGGGSTPLALLCVPVSRRADGVQVPLAAAWPHVAAALAAVLHQLLRRALGGQAEGEAAAAAAEGPPGAVGRDEPAPQQLQLQPVASCIHGADVAGGAGLGDAAPPWGGPGGGYSSFTLSCSSTGDLGPQTPATRGGVGAGAGTSVCSHVGSVTGRPVAGLQGTSFTDVTEMWFSNRTGAAMLSLSCAAAGPSGTAAGTSSAAATARAAAATAAAPCCAAVPPAPPPPPPAAGPAEGPPPRVLQSVVLLRCNGSWASGVVVESSSGLLLTTAHLFQRRSPARSGAATALDNGSNARQCPDGDGQLARRVSDEWADLQCWARVPWADGRGGVGGGGTAAAATVLACSACSAQHNSAVPLYRWLRARVLYMWSNHLDLAVLQLEPPYGSRWAAAPLAAAAVQETARAMEDPLRDAFMFRRTTTAPSTVQDGQQQQQGDNVAGGTYDMHGAYGAGSPVWAVGHSLVGPAAEWPALVSYGCVARVLRIRSGRPTLVVATTTTHAGGSGGALLDGQGRLVGLVTSNARHAGGATLPNMAFCIAAEELEPVVRWAAARARGAAAAVSPAAAPFTRGLSALAALDVEDEDAGRIWRLQMPVVESPVVPGGLAQAVASAVLSRL